MDRKEAITLCHLVLESVLEPKSAAYVAGPLDTGRVYFDSLASGISPHQEIRRVNEMKLTDFARKLRKQLPFPVIDPGLLRITDWRGEDYAQFFLEVIDIFVREVWFIDGWEFSSGATKEFTHCVQRGIKCLESTGLIISLEKGREKIKNAIQYVESIGGDARKLLSHLP